MLRILIALQTFGVNLRHRANEDRGSVTLEQVVITAALFIVAGLVVAAITAAVNARLNGIG